jgi:mannose-6-phosphate isomerase-like protein (cupin superfamily)
MARVELTNIPKMWGKEVILVDDSYCVKLLKYDGVRTSSKHYHERKHETFAVLTGEFDIEWYPLDNPGTQKTQRFFPGMCLVLPPFTVHRLTCVSPKGGTIFEASSHEDPDDCVRLEPSVNPFGQG